jgi:hypothetical protein
MRKLRNEPTAIFNPKALLTLRRWYAARTAQRTVLYHFYETNPVCLCGSMSENCLLALLRSP